MRPTRCSATRVSTRPTASPAAPVHGGDPRHAPGRGARLHEPLYVTTRVLAVDDKRVQLFHSCIAARDEALRRHVPSSCTCTSTPPRARRAPMDPACAPSWQAIQAAQAAVCRAAEAGRASASATATLESRPTAMPKIVDHDAAPRRDRPGRLSRGCADTASIRPPSCASRARRATPPAWWRITSTPSRTSLSPRCA